MEKITPFTIPGSEKQILYKNFNDMCDIINSIDRRLEQEAAERKKSDKKNIWISVGMAFLAFALGIIADHLPEIIELAKSLLVVKPG